MTTYCFDCSYKDGGGVFFGVVSAPDEATAKRLLALEIIQNNGWDAPSGIDPYCSNFSSLRQFLDIEMRIEREWTDLFGSACPNCTSHNGRATDRAFEIAGVTREVFECGACGYTWVPLGLPAGTARSADEINAELDAWERENMPESSDADD